MIYILALNLSVGSLMGNYTTKDEELAHAVCLVHLESMHCNV